MELILLDNGVFRKLVSKSTSRQVIDEILLQIYALVPVRLVAAHFIWDKYVGIPLDNAESPAFTGRAVVALATDPNNLQKSGTYQVVAELAEEYGFTDIDGTTPPSIRSLKFLVPAYGLDEETRKKVPSWLIPDWKLPFSFMAQGRPPPPENDED